MKARKIVSVVVWVLVSLLFFYFVEDTGRSIGAKSQSQFEENCKYYIDRLDKMKINYTDLANYEERVEPKVYLTAEEIGAFAGESIMGEMLRSHYDIEKEYQSAFKEISIYMIIYVLSSMICFYCFITEPKKNE